MFTEDWRHGGFGLYLHWPYCLSKCPYCDFNSHVTNHIDHSAWADAYRREIERAAALTPGRLLQTVYFGGGTPSLMEPETVDVILSAIRKGWSLANDIEITMEANPTSVEAGKFRAFRDSGVNRVSMGLQALNDTDLRRLGRTHTVAEARRAFETAANIFDRTTFDLIYARQYQTLQNWQQELTEALALQSGHMSLYQLTVEDGTIFARRHKLGQLKGLPDDDLGADFYELTQDLCDAAGLPAYEVSNHARPGEESRHNQVYWNSGDFVGVGPGAHGRLTLDGARISTAAPKAPLTWLKQAQSGGAEDLDARLSKEEQATEFLLMGLRLRNGIDLERFEGLSGKCISPSKIQGLTELGLVACEDNRLRATDAGRPLLNALLRELLVDL